MRIQLRDDLPFVTVNIHYRGQEIAIPNVLIDTGSATSMFSADWLSRIGIQPEADDVLQTVRGVGGVEVVYLRQVDNLTVDTRKMENFEIEVGGMDYGFQLDGILGMDFLVPAGAMIDLKSLEIAFG